MKKNILKSIVLVLLMQIVIMLTACSSKKEQVVIYTTLNEKVIEHMSSTLSAQFPDYDIIVEYQSTSKLGAKLMAEGTNTDCDIIFSLAYENLQQLEDATILADLSSYDRSVFVEDTLISNYFLPEIRCGGAIVVNTELLTEKGLAVPQSYEDLLKPEYKNLITMPDPKASGSGYVFVKALSNAWGDEATIEYFAALSENILQFTSGSSGVVNSLIQKETAIGLTLITNGVMGINEGAPLEIIVPAEGAPCSVYGEAIIAGKESRSAVKDVFDYIVAEYNPEHCREFYPEQIYKNQLFEVENYPSNFSYADMSNNTLEVKEFLLGLWSEKIN